MFEEIACILVKLNLIPNPSTMPQTTTSKTNIFWSFDLQTARYRREAIRALQEGQGCRTDTWADFRV